MTMRPLMTLAAVLMGLLAAGCLRLEREHPEKRHYLIEVARDGSSASPASDAGVLYLRRFDVSPAFEASSFVYRTGEFSWESDYYNLFFMNPDVMLTGLTSRWLQDAGLFSRVVTRGSQVRPDFQLEGHVVSLYGDYREGRPPEAVIEIQFLLLRDESDETEIVYQGDYTGRETVAGNTAESLIAAWNAALQAILRKVERDLSAALSGGTVSTPEHQGNASMPGAHSR